MSSDGQMTWQSLAFMSLSSLGKVLESPLLFSVLAPELEDPFIEMCLCKLMYLRCSLYAVSIGSLPAPNLKTHILFDQPLQEHATRECSHNFHI